jgi:hypothetical protein
MYSFAFVVICQPTEFRRPHLTPIAEFFVVALQRSLF